MFKNKMMLPLFMAACFTTSASAIELVNKPYAATPKASPAEIKSGLEKQPAETTAQSTYVPTAKPTQVWSMEAKDVNYFGVFTRWAEKAGYQVRWDAGKHFFVEAVSTFNGSFEDVVTEVLNNPAVAHSKYPLEVCFYPNTPPLARITRKGEQEKECN